MTSNYTTNYPNFGTDEEQARNSSSQNFTPCAGGCEGLNIIPVMHIVDEEKDHSPNYVAIVVRLLFY